MTQDKYSERRKRQRFLAVRSGMPCFWILLGDARIPLIDISLSGFSIASTTEPKNKEPFEFVLRLEGIPDKIKGLAQHLNYLPGEPTGQVGCGFVSLEGEGAMRLHEWLTVHVIAGASVRITTKEAERIVEGPSLI